MGARIATNYDIGIVWRALEIAVGLIRTMPPIVMVFRDICAVKINDTKRANGWEDKKLQITAIIHCGAGLQMDSDMLLVKAGPQSLHPPNSPAIVHHPLGPIGHRQGFGCAQAETMTASLKQMRFDGDGLCL